MVHRCYDCGQSMTYKRLAEEPWLSAMGEVVCGACIGPEHFKSLDTPVLLFNRDGPLAYRSGGRRCPVGRDLHAVVLRLEAW